MERVYFIVKILFSGYSIQTVMSLINDVKFVISNLDYEINLYQMEMILFCKEVHFMLIKVICYVLVLII